MRELLLGCGSRTEKLLFFDNKRAFEDVVRVDNNPDHKPDIIWDLKSHPLPFSDNEFDEIHMYEVLEHLAGQGDYRFFFAEFSEYWRILKPGGKFIASVPATSSVWALGDPSHTRVFAPQWLTFLSQAEYNKQVGVTPMSDFRSIYKADFKAIFAKEQDESFFFALEAIK